MKLVVGILYMLITLTSAAQTARGLSLAESPKTEATGKTYALIVGISKYQNPAIPSLQFADKDAIAFRNYLVATGVDSNNITLFTNENARFAEIILALDDICTQKAKPGDRVFIYFSGHGDVESHVITNVGYLLPYDAPKVVYAISAINVRTLQDYVNTLSANGVQAVVIVDACHAGNLAGGAEGLKNIQTILSDKWKDEVKILSCQPGELSLEGKEWGGGRGLFSYELIRGLTGLADKNYDGKVSLRELNLYLLDKVADEAHPMLQNPVLNGDMSANIAVVDQKLLTKLLSERDDKKFASVEAKGLEESLLRGLSDTVRNIYKIFKLRLDSNFLNGEEPVFGDILAGVHSGSNFLNGNNNKIYGAYYYLQQIPENASTRPLLSYMKKCLATKMINEVDYLITATIENRSYDNNGYVIYSMNTDNREPITEMIGNDKVKSLGLLPKFLYMEALDAGAFTKETSNGIAKLDSAINLDPNAAYAIQLKAYILQDHGNDSLAIQYALRAHNISPNFAYPYRTLGTAFREMSKFDSSVYYFKQLTLIDTMVLYGAYKELGISYFLLGHDDSATHYFNLMRQKDKLLSDSSFVAYVNLLKGFGSYQCKNYEKAIPYYLAALKFNPHSNSNNYDVACCYSLAGNKINAIKYFEIALKEGFKDFHHIGEDRDLNNIRNEPEFEKLMKKYFPDQYKD